LVGTYLTESLGSRQLTQSWQCLWMRVQGVSPRVADATSEKQACSEIEIENREKVGGPIYNN
jgi:hypothetical protein